MCLHVDQITWNFQDLQVVLNVEKKTQSSVRVASTFDY